jgi:hypothetical protein
MKEFFIKKDEKPHKFIIQHSKFKISFGLLNADLDTALFAAGA